LGLDCKHAATRSCQYWNFAVTLFDFYIGGNASGAAAPGEIPGEIYRVSQSVSTDAYIKQFVALRFGCLKPESLEFTPERRVILMQMSALLPTDRSFVNKYLRYHCSTGVEQFNPLTPTVTILVQLQSILC